MNTNNKTLLDNVAVDGASDPMFVKSYAHLLVEVVMVAFTGKVQLCGSINDGDDLPDFSASQSLANPWDFIQAKDLQSGASVNGDDGLSGTATTDVRLLEVNTNRLSFLGAKVSTHSGGSVSVKVVGIVEK